MTATIVLTLTCQCYPPVSREVPADRDRATWERLLLRACRRRGCRCVRHELTAEPAR